MNYRTLADLARLCRENVHRIPHVDAVVGIPRSGMIAASMIATLTNQQLQTLSPSGQRDSILLVDDSISGGETMRRELQHLRTWYPRAAITTLAVFMKPNSPRPDIHFEVVAGPRVFEYNWHRSKWLTSAVLDIDGVISTPTQPGERDGQLLYRPARKPLALATGRREYERDVTEKWLLQQGVQYGKLFMTNLAPEIRGGKVARETKLRACEEMKPRWFVESNIHQAEWLHARTGLPVLCIDENKMVA